MKSPVHQLLELSAEIEKKATIPKNWVDNGYNKEPESWTVLDDHARNTMKSKDEIIRVMYEALENACVCYQTNDECYVCSKRRIVNALANGILEKEK